MKVFGEDPDTTVERLRKKTQDKGGHAKRRACQPESLQDKRLCDWPHKKPAKDTSELRISEGT